MNSDMSALTEKLVPILAPLKKTEERRAVKAAVDHFTAQWGGRPAPRFRILGSELRVDKPQRRGSPPKRLIRVLITDYDNKRTVDTTVDANGKVVESAVLDDFQPALHPDEIDEAREIAERDTRVARLAKVRGSYTLTFVPAPTAETGHRMVGLHYVAPGRRSQLRALATVSVDLSEGTLVLLTEPRASGGESQRGRHSKGNSRGSLR